MNSSNAITSILFASDSVERERIKNIIVNKHGPYVNLLDEYACPTKTLESIAVYRPDILFLSAPIDSQVVVFFIEALQKTDFTPHIIITNTAISESFFPSHQTNNREPKTHCFVTGVNKKYYQFELDSIAYIKSNSDTAVIHFLSGETKTVGHSLLQLEKMLPSFLRVGRFYLINPKNVQSIDGPKRTCSFINDLFIPDLSRPNLLLLINHLKTGNKTGNLGSFTASVK